MRLVRFLAAGKSLVGSKDLAGRYRLPEGRALPKFNSNRPVPPQKGAETLPSSEVAEATRIEHAESVTPNPEGAASLMEQVSEGNPAATPSEGTQPTGGTAPGGEARPAVGGPSNQVLETAAPTTYPRLADPAPPRRSVLRALFGWLPGLRGKAARGPIPVFSKVPVQTELSLENVKVVRNDLTESDLELKPVTPAKAPAAVSARVESGEVAMRTISTGEVNNGPG